MKHLPDLPPNMPRMGNAFTRWLGYRLLRLQGWKITGELPNVKKLMAIGAPHTSNWDFVVAMPAILALGLKFSFLMKKEAFFFPFKNLFMWLGGIPTDRSRAKNVAAQAAEEFEKRDKLWMGITPEGTRSKVTRWKTGFMRIAKEADVPILLVAFDGANKEIRFDKVVVSEGDIDTQVEELRIYMTEKFKGINPKNQ